MVFVYAIQLEEGKYYIGKTNNPQFRLESHFNSNGSEWTKMFRPLRVIEIIPNCDDYDEDKITRQYMDKYGINNVRGGSFVSVKLNKSIIKTLRQMSNGTNNKCFVCGKAGHFAKNCQEDEYLYSDVEYDKYEEDDDEDEEDDDVFECEYCGKEFIGETDWEYHEKRCNSKYKTQMKLSYKSDEYDNSCFRCGRLGHYASSCYASRHVNGYYLKK